VTPSIDDQQTRPNLIDEGGSTPRVNLKRWRAVLCVVLGSVLLGTLVGLWLALRGTSLFSADGNPTARPTIVIAARATPAPAANSPVPSPSPVSDAYTVEPGDTMRSIAQKVYGDANSWPQIYDANRDVIGPDPDTLQPGTLLRIPPP
jgi:nucleoid-associated protein YgaU